MKRVTKYRYEVRSGDRVRLRITPLNGATGKVTVASNGKRLANKGSATSPRFELVADQFPGNSHFVLVEYSFLGSAPSSAEYETRLEIQRGAKKKSWSDFPNIKKKNKTRERNFRFTVVQRP